MKIAQLIVGILLLMAVVVGFVELFSLRSETATIDRMKSVCEASMNDRSGTVDKQTDQCQKLIDQVQAKGFEVLQNDGKYWVEY